VIYRIVATVLLVALSSAGLQGCGGPENRKASAMERGQQFLAKENYQKARIEFGNALQIDPNDADARYYSAFAAEKLSDFRAAAQGYQQALNVDSTHPLAVAALARLYVFSGLPQQALDMVERALAAHPGDPNLLVVSGAAKQALGREQEALDDANAALSAKPDLEYAVAFVAGIERKRGERQQAIALVEESLERLPNSVDLRAVLAQLYVDLGDTARAETELKEIVGLRPADLEPRQRLVAFYASTGNLDAAEAALRDLISRKPDSVDYKMALINFLSTQRSFDVAENELRSMIAKTPRDENLRLAAGQFYELHNMPDDAKRVYEGIIERAGTTPPALSARNRLATMLIRSNNIPGASVLISQVLDRNPRDNDALLLRASLALARNDALDAITDLRAVLRDQPESAGVLRTLARAHVENNEPDLARENYRRAVAAAPANVETRIEYADFLVKRREFDEARQLIDGALKISPQDLPALQAQFTVLSAMNDAPAAAEVANDIVKFYPDNAVGYYYKGVLQEAAGSKEAAQASYEQALVRKPGGREPLEGIARILLTSNRREEAIKRLELELEQVPNDVSAMNLLAQIYLSGKQYDRAEELVDRAIGAQPTWWVPYRTKAWIELAKGDKANAKATYATGMSATNDEPGLGIELAALYEQSGEVDKAIELYERLQANSPNSEPLANNLAMLLSTYREDKDSREREQLLVRGFRNSDNPAYLDTYGWVRYRQGQFDEAVTCLRRASAAAPENIVMHYHLGMALKANGQPDQARVELEAALKSEQPFIGRDAARQTLEALPRTPG
jgi:tetratricopeptide (TPR) repeat protein